MMALVHWGDTHMVDERGRPLLHEHRKCGKMFDPVMVCPNVVSRFCPRKFRPTPVLARARLQSGLLRQGCEAKGSQESCLTWSRRLFAPTQTFPSTKHHSQLTGFWVAATSSTSGTTSFNLCT